MLNHEEYDIPFEDGPPLLGPWPPQEWDLLEAGFETHWSFAYEEDDYTGEPVLADWRPQLPESLDGEGWLLAGKHWYGVPSELDGRDMFVAAALWARRPLMTPAEQDVSA